MGIKRFAAKVVENKGVITHRALISVGTIVGLIVVDSVVSALTKPSEVVVVEGDLNIESSENQD